jgi:putative ABC transport system ATP-binding protein
MVRSLKAPAPPIVAEHISRTYRLGNVEVRALRGVSLTLQTGDFLAIAGTSGSGKSTMLNLLGCVDPPTGGKLYVDGYDVSKMDSWILSRLRAKKIGFVFQTFNLLPTLSALENVEYPLLLLGMKGKERKDRAREALVKVGLEKVIRHRPSEMSGGQRQRVAIARAMVKQPKLILADEPTANLDRKTAEAVLQLMLDLNLKEKMTFVFATHDPLVMSLARRVIHMRDGSALASEASDDAFLPPREASL